MSTFVGFSHLESPRSPLSQSLFRVVVTHSFSFTRSMRQSSVNMNTHMRAAFPSETEYETPGNGLNLVWWNWLLLLLDCFARPFCRSCLTMFCITFLAPTYCRLTGKVCSRVASMCSWMCVRYLSVQVSWYRHSESPWSDVYHHLTPEMLFSQYTYTYILNQLM